jgi:hypothetical protein
MWDLWWAKWHWGRFSPSISVPLPILIPPTTPHSSPTTRGWYNRPNIGRRTKLIQPHPSPRNLKKNYWRRTVRNCSQTFICHQFLNLIWLAWFKYMFVDAKVVNIFPKSLKLPYQLSYESPQKLVHFTELDVSFRPLSHCSQSIPHEDYLEPFQHQRRKGQQQLNCIIFSLWNIQIFHRILHVVYQEYCCSYLSAALELTWSS